MPHALSETPTQSPNESEAASALQADALRAEAWAGEPFLRPDEDPEVVLAPGTAAAARSTTRSPRWKPGATRRHRVEGALRADARARAGALRAAAAPRLRHRAAPPPGGRARRDAHRADRRRPEERERQRQRPRRADRRGRRAEDELGLAAEAEGEAEDEADEPLPVEQDPGSVRRYRFRHPTASGKTIAASGFVEAARTEGVLILTHRRLLVDQFRRELTEHGYGERFTDAILTGHTAPRPSTRSRSRPTPGSRATSTRSRATRTSS